MIPIRNKIRIITRSRYSARIYHGKKNGDCFANALRTTRSTLGGIVFSEDDAKGIAEGAESFAQKKTPPSGPARRSPASEAGRRRVAKPSKVLGGVPPLPQIKLIQE
jgi:hypothetical protein